MCLRVHMSVCLILFVYSWGSVCLPAWVCVRPCILCASGPVFIFLGMYACMHTCVCVNLCVSLCVHVCGSLIPCAFPGDSVPSSSGTCVSVCGHTLLLLMAPRGMQAPGFYDVFKVAAGWVKWGAAFDWEGGGGRPRNS